MIANRIGLAVERDALGYLEAYSFLPHRRHEAVAHVVVKGEALGRQDDEQPPTAGGDQLFRRLIGEAVIVVVDIRMRRRKLRPAVTDEGKARFQQEFHPLVGRFGAAEEDAVGHAVADDVADGVDLRRIGKMRGDDEVIGRAAQCRRHAPDHRGAVAEDFLMRVQDEADNIGAAGAQALGRPVGQVTDLCGCRLHALAGLAGNQRIVAQRARHGGHRKPGQFGNRLQRRLSVGAGS
ncbi:hypothetical protein D3C80_313800 [compost metagenome]